MNDVEPISSTARAAVLIADPIRPRILASARAPVSAADLARTLGLTRQRMNYHVRQLAQHAFLLPAGQQRKGNMVEQQYVASARAYVLTANILAEVAPDPTGANESVSAAELVALCAKAQSDVATVMAAAQAAGVRVRTMSRQTDMSFESVEQRTEFTHALLEAVDDVVETYAASPITERARPFRLVLGCYPLPANPPR